MDKYFNINAEGCSIRCKLYSTDRDEVRKLILFGHGFGGHKDNKAAERFAKRVLEKNKNIAVMTFNWPCHGDDVHKKLRLEDCDTYVRLILSWVNEQFATPELYVYATSFGGYLFLKYISETGMPFVKMAFRCPAVNMYEVIQNAIMTDDNWKLINKGKSALVGFDRKIEIDKVFLDSLQEADITKRNYLEQADYLLILQGTKDEIVPFEAVKAFAENNVIEFDPIEGADHRFMEQKKMELAISRIIAFFGLK